MGSTWLVILLLAAFWTVSARFVEPAERVRDRPIDLLETDSDVNAHSTGIDTLNRLQDDHIAEVKQLLDAIAEERAIEEYLTQEPNLEDCKGGKCEVCLKPRFLGRFKNKELCFEAVLKKGEIAMTIKLGNKDFNAVITAGKGRQTFEFERKDFGKNFPKRLKQKVRKIVLKVNNVDFKKKKFCIQITVQLRLLRRFKFPVLTPFKCYRF